MEERNINLVINRLSQARYDQLKRDGQLCADQLYFVNDPTLSGDGKTIINVADPVLSNDAATKNYVDTRTSSIDLSEYYKKSETSSSIELSTAFNTNTTIIDYDILPEETYITEDLLIQQMSSTIEERARYKLVKKYLSLSSINVDGLIVLALICLVDDFAINTLSVTSNEYPVVVYLPPVLSSNYSRDFCIRIECYLSSCPTLCFFGSNSESCDFESDNDEWATLELGANLFNFTETKRS